MRVEVKEVLRRGAQSTVHLGKLFVKTKFRQPKSSNFTVPAISVTPVMEEAEYDVAVKVFTVRVV